MLAPSNMTSLYIVTDHGIFFCAFSVLIIVVRIARLQNSRSYMADGRPGGGRTSSLRRGAEYFFFIFFLNVVVLRVAINDGDKSPERC